jgi:hypothetical protein
VLTSVKAGDKVLLPGCNGIKVEEEVRLAAPSFFLFECG